MPSATALDEEECMNALSIDGGSIASLMSTIEVLEELMGRIQRELGLSEPPRPCKHFRLMAGAGFTGLLVLGMSLREAKKYCISIMDETFSERKVFSHQAFKATKLRDAVESMLKSCGAGVDARMLESCTGDPEECNVLICVAADDGTSAEMPVYLRTYPVDANSSPDCTVLEAICATLAVPGLFKPMAIADIGGIESTYTGFSSFNPMVQLLEEATGLFQNGRMTCVLSVGARHKDASAAECERVAREMSTRFMNRPGVYFRVSVGQGMETIRAIDSEKRSDGVLHARSYLRLLENSTKITEIAHTLLVKQEAIPIGQLGGVVPAVSATNYTAKNCPPPSILFVGREAQLSRMERCLVNDTQERRVCVLHGLGGVGKTQLALKFVEIYGSKYEHIFYIDCTSSRTVEADLKNIADVNDAGDCFGDALTWLARLKESWLIVYNNADDTSLKLRGYFPACSRGNILITTRNRGMISLAQGAEAECDVSNMTKNEALKLLAEASGVVESVGPTGIKLVEVVGCFPLAIVQAGAYIRSRSCTLEEYLEMYQSSRGQILEEYAGQVQKPDNYEHTVYATWQLSYARLNPVAKQLCDLLAFLHHDQISEDIFRFAVLGLENNDESLPPTDQEIGIKLTTAKLLENFTRLVDGVWDKNAFLRTVENLTSYSLLTYDPTNRCYSIHPLVQQWTRTVVANPDEVCSCAAFMLASSVTRAQKVEDYAMRRMLLNHIDSLPEVERTRPRLAGRFRLVYHEAGRIGDEEMLLNAEHGASVLRLGSDHPLTLRSMDSLARICYRQRRWTEAEQLSRKVLDIRRRVWSNKHLELLRSLKNLASIYADQQRWKEVEALEREALDIRERVWGNQHPDTLSNLSDLAATYRYQERWEEADALERKVLETRRRVWGDEHPDTLAKMSGLSMEYMNQGRWGQAEVLQREVVDIEKRLWGNEHPETLRSMNSLAITCTNQGNWEQAERLQRQVVEMGVRVWGGDKPETLKNMVCLSDMLAGRGQWDDARVLQEEVIEIEKRVWGEEDPRTLRGISKLGYFYGKQDRWKDAETIERSLLELRKRLWGDENPETLRSLMDLVYLCSMQERWKDAVALQRELLQIETRVWGSEHPRTLRTMCDVSVSYRQSGQQREADSLLITAIEVSKRTLGDSHPETAYKVMMLKQAREDTNERWVLGVSMAIFLVYLLLWYFDSLPFTVTYRWQGFARILPH
ncbi:hypothetical protein FRC09_001430 [Ceratobasidium sp. 395]|nr:hypothetical protein FRC09_001430 [Ceratobasidium sp. 395]